MASAKIWQIRTQRQKLKKPAPDLKAARPTLRLKPVSAASQSSSLREAHDKQGVMQLKSPGQLAKIISNF